MPDVRTLAITGVIPPETAEARIRERWPSVARFGAIATLGRILTRTIVLAPLAWLIMAPFYFAKVLPIFARRYVVTNRRVAILGGWSCRTLAEVPLSEIDDVEVIRDANTDFYRAATVVLKKDGQELLRLPGTPEPYVFSSAILNAVYAWVPGKSKKLPFLPAK